jgi:hypothetical protein
VLARVNPAETGRVIAVPLAACRADHAAGAGQLVERKSTKLIPAQRR